MQVKAKITARQVHSLFPSNVASVINEVKISRQVRKRMQQIYSTQKHKSKSNN